MRYFTTSTLMVALVMVTLCSAPAWAQTNDTGVPVVRSPDFDEETLRRIYEDGSRAVVGVASMSIFGAGLVLDDNLVVVAASNVDTGREIVVFVPSAGDIEGDLVKVPAEILTVDDALGLALLRVEHRLDDNAPVLAGQRAFVGESVVVLCAAGHDMGHRPRMLTGYVSSMGDDGLRELLLDDQSSICGSNWFVGGRGAPVLNRAGEVVGVITAERGWGLLHFEDSGVLVDMAARAPVEPDAPIPWDMDVVFDYGLDAIGVGSGDGSILLSVGLGLRLVLWDRLVAVVGGAVLLGGSTEGLDDDLRSEFHVGGRGDFGLGYRWLLTAPEDPMSMHIEVVAGVSLIDLVRVRERSLETGGTEIEREYRDLMVQPSLKATFRFLDAAEFFVFGRLDPERPERSSFGFGTGVSF